MSVFVNSVKLCSRFTIVRRINKALFCRENIKFLNGRMSGCHAKLPACTFLSGGGRKTSSRYCVLFSGLLGFFRSEETEPESELILTMKRSVLLMQRGELDKAEQMLHLALKMAQELQNAQAVTYVYDLLANLAYDRGDLVKAEPLFVSVLQRLLGSGTPASDNKVVHISLKIADIFTKRREPSKAENGFKFCVENLEKKIDAGVDDEDTLTLWGMTLDWFGRFLLEENRAAEALECFEKAYRTSLKVHGEEHEQTVVLLNDLGTVAFLCGDHDRAVGYLGHAVEVGRRLPGMQDFAAVHVNLGAVYLKKGMYREARHACETALRDARAHDNKEGVEEANTCLDQVKRFLHSEQ
ncbi:tetratricopeptide repeat protein 19 homolog, mitochondrial [Bacillus rossius redtenbacheri]|uniref:tetratricopeptide repeat protein 19 homolog, mitochondrial n=1 Tax=Bacillus rossius redtenbacheri TaxID=93214 RepID=UPI002FDD2400